MQASLVSFNVRNFGHWRSFDLVFANQIFPIIVSFIDLSHLPIDTKFCEVVTGVLFATSVIQHRGGPKGFLRGSYTRSRYYGNFDQDNSTVTVSNDANIFIGSSNIADGSGRQLWNFKLGTLRGDRPNALKVYGAYFLPWNSSLGAYVIAQSGQPWETWNYEPYLAFSTVGRIGPISGPGPGPAPAAPTNLRVQ